MRVRERAEQRRPRHQFSKVNRMRAHGSAFPRIRRSFDKHIIGAARMELKSRMAIPPQAERCSPPPGHLPPPSRSPPRAAWLLRGQLVVHVLSIFKVGLSAASDNESRVFASSHAHAGCAPPTSRCRFPCAHHRARAFACARARLGDILIYTLGVMDCQSLTVSVVHDMFLNPWIYGAWRARVWALGVQAPWAGAAP